MRRECQVEDTQLQLIPPSHVIEAFDNDGRQFVGDAGLQLLFNSVDYDPNMADWVMRGCSELTVEECDKSLLDGICQNGDGACKDARALRWSCFCPK